MESKAEFSVLSSTVQGRSHPMPWIVWGSGSKFRIRGWLVPSHCNCPWPMRLENGTKGKLADWRTLVNSAPGVERMTGRSRHHKPAIAPPNAGQRSQRNAPWRRVKGVLMRNQSLGCLQLRWIVHLRPSKNPAHLAVAGFGAGFETRLKLRRAAPHSGFSGCKRFRRGWRCPDLRALLLQRRADRSPSPPT